MMIETVNVRPAIAQDAPKVRACVQAAFAPYIAVIGRRPAPMDAPYERLIDAGHVYIAKVPEAGCVGVMVYYAVRTSMLLDTLAVAPHVAGHGLGTHMMGVFEARARQASARSAVLYTNVSMTRNIAFYQRLGYRETERRTVDGFQRVFFEKEF